MISLFCTPNTNITWKKKSQERKGSQRSARATNIDSKLERLLHDDPIDIVRIPNIRFVERSNENFTTESGDLVVLKDYFDTKFNTLEAKTTNKAQAVRRIQNHRRGTELDEKSNS